MYIGEIIKDYRIKHDLSQRTFANMSGLSASYVNTLEKIYNPKTMKPYAITTDVAIKIATTMNISTEQLLNTLAKEQNIALNSNLKDKITSTVNMLNSSEYSNVRMIPLYYKITNIANWKKENLVGYIPIGVNVQRISTSGFYFYYKYDKTKELSLVSNELYLLIKEQNFAKNNNLVISLVNKKIAIGKYQKLQNDIILLEDLFCKTPHDPILIDLRKDEFQIIGKIIGYYGKM